MLALTIVFQPVMISLACQPPDPPPDCSTYESALAAARAQFEDAQDALDDAEAALNAAKAALESAKKAEAQARNAAHAAANTMNAAYAVLIQAIADQDDAERANETAVTIATGAATALAIARAGKNPVAIAAAWVTFTTASIIQAKTFQAWLNAINATNVAQMDFDQASANLEWYMGVAEKAKANTIAKQQLVQEKQNAYDQAFQKMEAAKEAVDNALDALNNCLNSNN